MDESIHTCKDCIHLYVTYDPHFPYGCRAMGFKGKEYPYLMVRSASGMPCLMRLVKDEKKKGSQA